MWSICICIYAYMHVCIHLYIYICTCVYMCVCTYVYMYICIYVYMYTCIYVYMYICKYVHTYICIYVYAHMYVCIYIYTYVFIFTYIHKKGKHTCSNIFKCTYTHAQKDTKLPHVCVCVHICHKAIPLATCIGHIRERDNLLYYTFKNKVCHL